MQKTSVERNGQRFYDDLPSVTTILQALSKPNLMPWYARQAAAEAVDGMLHGLTVDDFAALYPQTVRTVPKGLPTPEMARRYLAGAANRNRNTAGSLGTLVHAVADAESRGEPWPDIPAKFEPALIQRYVNQFNRWQRDYSPAFVASELEVRNLNVGYGGRFDSVLDFPVIDERVSVVSLNDYKTGDDIFPEVALQTAAYRNATEMRVNGEWLPMLPTDTATVLHLTPDDYEFVEVPPDVQAYHWETFQHLAEVWHWAQRVKDAAWYVRL